MPLSKPLQDKLDAAQQRNDAAKKDWQSAVDFWNTHFVNLKCYKDKKYDVVAAATWFTPNDSSCSEGTGCTHSDKVNCKSEIALVRNHIGSIRNSYTELDAAQKNYDAVFSEVTNEAKNDPAFILQQNQIEANASANRLKWIFWIAVVVIVALAAFVWFKWIKKKI